MAEHNQRIHPVDVEAPTAPPPTAPLVPRNAVKSEKGDPAADDIPYPPHRRTIPVHHSKPPKRRRGLCCRCFCWSVCLLLALLVLAAITAGALYLIYKPKSPRYTVDRLRVSAFALSSDAVTATFDVTVTATNPNSKIGIYYVDGSRLTASYNGTDLAEGALPVFYQGHRNTTVLTVVMRGRAQLGGEAVAALVAAQQTGSVPLEIDGRVPVRIRFGGLKLWKVTFGVRCHVVVSGLSVSNQISIRSGSCKLSKFKLF